MYLDKAQVPAHLRQGYGGTKFVAVICETVCIPADAGLWSGGSRDVFSAINLATGQSIPLPGQTRAPFDRDGRDGVVNLPPGGAIVRHSVFMGKDSGLTFYVRAENAAALLPAPAPDALSPAESVTLRCVCSYVSSYRRAEAARHGVTAGAYEAAVISLQARGLLSRNGGATPAGKNAAAALPRL